MHMGIKLEIQNSEFKELEKLQLSSPKFDLKISDELKSDSDIFVSRYDTLINLKYLKDKKTNHIIGTSPSIEDELKKIISFINDHKTNTIEGRIDEHGFKTVEISNESDFDAKYLQLVKDIDLNGYHDSINNKLKLVTNEFYTNDIFHRVSNQKYGEISISQNSTKIIVNYKSYTNVAKSQIVDSLYRAAKEKTPRQEGRGAGLGMYMILKNCDRLQIVERKDVTDFYVYFEMNKRYKEMSKRIPSISFYNLKD